MACGRRQHTPHIEGIDAGVAAAVERRIPTDAQSLCAQITADLRTEVAGNRQVVKRGGSIRDEHRITADPAIANGDVCSADRSATHNPQLIDQKVCPRHRIEIACDRCHAQTRRCVGTQPRTGADVRLADHEVLACRSVQRPAHGQCADRRVTAAAQRRTCADIHRLQHQITPRRGRQHAGHVERADADVASAGQYSIAAHDEVGARQIQAGRCIEVTLRLQEAEGHRARGRQRRPATDGGRSERDVRCLDCGIARHLQPGRIECGSRPGVEVTPDQRRAKPRRCTRAQMRVAGDIRQLDRQIVAGVRMERAAHRGRVDPGVLTADQGRILTHLQCSERQFTTSGGCQRARHVDRVDAGVVAALQRCVTGHVDQRHLEGAGHPDVETTVARQNRMALGVGARQAQRVLRLEQIERQPLVRVDRQRAAGGDHATDAAAVGKLQMDVARRAATVEQPHRHT